MLAVDDQRPGPSIPERMNLAHHVLFAGKAPDDKPALCVLRPDRVDTWTYAALRDRVLRTARGFRDLGLVPGSPALMRLGNSPDFPFVYLGAIWAGVIPVPTSAALGQSEVDRIGAALDPDVIVAHPGIALPQAPCPVVAPDALLAQTPLDTPFEADADAPAYIVFTSGTSGQPMGVVHAHRAIFARQMMFDGWYGLTPTDRVLHAGAFNWTFTLGTGLLDPWTMGATALVLADGTGLDELTALAARHRTTILAGAPGVFRRLLRNAPFDLPRLRHGLAAGEKLPEALRTAWHAATGTDLVEAFGQSECSTFISGSPERPAPPGTIGYAQKGRAVAILAGDAPAKRGEMGEIAVHSGDPGLCLGYLNSPPPAPSTWRKTGDMGLMRDDGAIEYHGRADDMLTAGGFRVSPLEVEAAMLSCTGVEEAAAVDHRLNETTIVIALHYTGRETDDAALAAHSEAHLAPYKRPRLFIHEQALPRNANGKLLRKALRAENDTAT